MSGSETGDGTGDKIGEIGDGTDATTEGVKGAAAGPGAPFRVVRRFTLRTVGQVASALVLVLASIAFIAGGISRPASPNGILLITLGALGVAGFVAALVFILGPVLGRRPIMVLDDEGVHVPKAWPRRAARTLPWPEVAAVAAVDRGGAAGREVHHYVAFLPSEETAEAVRTASKAQLVALTLPDVPAMADAAPWTFTIEPDWNVTVKQIIDAAGRHGA